MNQTNRREQGKSDPGFNNPIDEKPIKGKEGNVLWYQKIKYFKSYIHWEENWNKQRILHKAN